MRFVIIFFLSLVIASATFAKDIEQEVKSERENIKNVKRLTTAPFQDEKWMEGEWVESDEAYAKLRQEIDRFTRERIFEFIEEQQRVAEDTDDIFASFGWVYAAYSAKKLYHGEKSDWVNQAYSHLEARSGELPNNYEWARLIFLIRVTHQADLRYQEVCLRLLRQNPGDNEVKFFLLRVINLKESNKRAIALKYLDELLKAEPERATVYAAAGSLYFRLWGVEDKTDYAHQAIKYYQLYLDKAPADHTFRLRAGYLIELIKKHSK